MHRPEPQTRRGSSRAGPGSSQEPGPPHDPWLSQRQALHDAANWLTVLLGHLERLRSAPDSARHLELARRAARAAHRLCALPPGLPTAPGTIDASRHLRRLVLHAEPAAARAGVRLECDATPLPPLRADLPGFEDAVLNLLRNALEASPTGGVVRVLLEPVRDGFARLRVLDEGPGIRDADRSELGRPGQSGKGGVDRGLGLSRVRSWLAVSGAELEIGDAPGGGASIGFSLPIAEESTDDEPPARRDGLRILLVEDDVAVAEVLVLLLRSDGHRVEHHADAESAERAFRPGAFDLVLCDQNLPDGTGGDLVSRFCRLDEDVACCVVTGAPESARPVAAGRVGVLAKPVSRDDLRRALSTARAAGPRARSHPA